LVEASLGFVALQALQVPVGFAAAVNEPICRGFPLGFAPFGPFSLGPQVDDGSHGEARR